ncbi:Type II/IV secretion system protein [uncultured archaeon]|nr:Type II/IV secretion system protein [uncultured archaeon]
MPEEESGLDELKRLTLGGFFGEADAQKPPEKKEEPKKEPKKDAAQKDEKIQSIHSKGAWAFRGEIKAKEIPSATQSSQAGTEDAQVNADKESFKEEQRIFTQISSVKELGNEPNYMIPEGLERSAKEKQGDNEESGAFEKLLNLTKAPLFENSKKEEIQSKSFGKQEIIKEKIVKRIDPNAKTISMKSSLDEAPKIIIPPEARKTIAVGEIKRAGEPLIAKPAEEKLIEAPKESKTKKWTQEPRIEKAAEAKKSFIAENKETGTDYKMKWGAQTKAKTGEGAEAMNASNTAQTPSASIRETPISASFITDSSKAATSKTSGAQEESIFARRRKELDEEKKRIEATLELKTPVDLLFSALEEHRQLDAGEAATICQVPYDLIEKLAKMFENDGVLEINYPTSLTKKPTIILKNPVASKLLDVPKGELLDNYTLTVDHVPAHISVTLSPGEARPLYAVQMPAIGKYTRRFLFFVKEEVAENMPIELEEIVDPKKSKRLKDRFFFELNSHLSKYFPMLPEEYLNMLSGVLLHEMYGLGDIELLMGDDMLEEVGINSAKTPITVYHRVHGWLKTNLVPGTEEDINNFASQIGRKVGREITILSPILDAHLLSGDRVNATLFPISSEGNTLTIRRFARKPWTIVDFIGKAHTMDSEMAAMLWIAMQYEMNVLIAGGTASGKTSALNSLLALVPTYHRIISIEDVREIVLPKYLEWNWIPMVTRAPNPEGLGEVTMLDLMVTSLRMRPDRIIVGEMRRKKEAEVLMEAIETGHSIYSTIHANSGYQVLRRLAEPPINIPLMQIELIDLIVVQYRDRKTNRRRTFEISEIEQTSTGQGLQINTVYKWAPRSDTWEKMNKPTKLITLLNMHTGMTEEDLFTEIEDRRKILDWMQRIGVDDLDRIGFIVKLFYSNPERVKNLAKKNAPAEEVEKIMATEQGEEAF